MAFALVSNTSQGSVNGAGFTTSSINTTGADLLVAVIGHFNGSSNPTLSDSKSNAWTALTAKVTATNNARNIIYYAKNPTVGSGHTFTISQSSNTFSSLCVAAYSGADITSPFDQENGSVGSSVAFIEPGSVTPTQNGELVISGLCLRDNGGIGQSVSIDDGFAITNQVPGLAGNRLSAAQAYLVQTTAAAVNPRWSWSIFETVASTIATFKAAAVVPKSRPIFQQPHRVFTQRF